MQSQRKLRLGDPPRWNKRPRSQWQYIVKRKYDPKILDYLQHFDDISATNLGVKCAVNPCMVDVRCMCTPARYKPELRWMRYQPLHMPLPRFRNNVTLYSDTYHHLRIQRGHIHHAVRNNVLFICQTIIRDCLIPYDVNFSSLFLFLGPLYLTNQTFFEFLHAPMSNFIVIWTTPYGEMRDVIRATASYSVNQGWSEALSAGTKKISNLVSPVTSLKNSGKECVGIDIGIVPVEPLTQGGVSAALGYASRVISAVYGHRRQYTTAVISCPPAMAALVAAELIAANITPLFYHDGQLTTLHMPFNELPGYKKNIAVTSLEEFSSFALKDGQHITLAYPSKELQMQSYKKLQRSIKGMKRWGLEYKATKMKMTEQEKKITNAERYGYSQFFIQLKRVEQKKPTSKVG